MVDMKLFIVFVMVSEVDEYMGVNFHAILQLFFSKYCIHGSL